MDKESKKKIEELNNITENISINYSPMNTIDFHSLCCSLKDIDSMNKEDRLKYEEYLNRINITFQKKSIKHFINVLLFLQKKNKDVVRVEILNNSKRSFINKGENNNNKLQLNSINEKVILNNLDVWFDYTSVEKCSFKNKNILDSISIIFEDENKFQDYHDINFCFNCLKYFIKIWKNGYIVYRNKKIENENKEKMIIDSEEDEIKKEEKEKENKNTNKEEEEEEQEVEEELNKQNNSDIIECKRRKKN